LPTAGPTPRFILEIFDAVFTVCGPFHPTRRLAVVQQDLFGGALKLQAVSIEDTGTTATDRAVSNVGEAARIDFVSGFHAALLRAVEGCTVDLADALLPSLIGAWRDPRGLCVLPTIAATRKDDQQQGASK
jgi:hypothetical protein